MEIKDIKPILEKAGWYQGRHLNADDIIRVYKMYDYPLFPNILELMISIGNIRIDFLNKRSGKNDFFDFDFEKACKMEVPERLIEEYNIRVKSELTVIGTAYRDYYIILMNRENTVFIAFDSLLFKCGNSIEEAICNIIDNVEFIEIPYLES